MSDRLDEIVAALKQSSHPQGWWYLAANDLVKMIRERDERLHDVQEQVFAQAESINALQAQLRERERELAAANSEIVAQDVALHAAEQEAERLREALRHYADREAWKEVETTFEYAPHAWAFDWSGDLGEKPWDIADAALLPRRPAPIGDKG